MDEIIICMLIVLFVTCGIIIVSRLQQTHCEAFNNDIDIHVKLSEAKIVIVCDSENKIHKLNHEINSMVSLLERMHTKYKIVILCTDSGIKFIPSNLQNNKNISIEYDIDSVVKYNINKSQISPQTKINNNHLLRIVELERQNCIILFI